MNHYLEKAPSLDLHVASNGLPLISSPSMKNAIGLDEASVALTIHILDQLIPKLQLQWLGVRLWNGTYWPDSEPKQATLVLNRPSALREMFSDCSEVVIGEAYIRGTFDIEGDIVAACELGDILASQTRGWSKDLAIASLLYRLPLPQDGKSTGATHKAYLNGKKNSIARDQKAIRFHYDVSNDFYALWLDSRMVYSCAYFETPDVDLEAAQLSKLDHICRKLNLQADERLLDIGSGWGGLLIHAATHYGVRADGITLSQNQLERTRRLVREKGLQDRINVRLIDYRALDNYSYYDKIVSVGMVEHVGRQNLGIYFEQAQKLLRPGGLFLNHGIGLGPVPRINHGESFIQQYVFPDSDLLSIGEISEIAERTSLEIRDVESLREHYALTLRHWVKRLEAQHERAVSETDEMTYRIWRLYMAGSAHGFSCGNLSIYQTLFSKQTSSGNSGAPMTRKKWYSF